jgi:hypothetical protein
MPANIWNGFSMLLFPGDRLLLYEKMQELDLNMSSLEAMSDSQLKELCMYCKSCKTLLIVQGKCYYIVKPRV